MELFEFEKKRSLTGNPVYSYQIIVTNNSSKDLNLTTWESSKSSASGLVVVCVVVVVVVAGLVPVCLFCLNFLKIESFTHFTSTQ